MSEIPELPVRHLVSLVPSISLDERSPSRIALVSEHGELELADLTPGLAEALRRLAHERQTRETLTKRVLRRDGIGAMSRFSFHFDDFAARCFLQFFAELEQTTLARLVLTVPRRPFRIPALPADRRFVLSRFAYCRRRNEELVVETPMRGAEVVVEDSRTAALLALLRRPHSVGELAAAEPGLSLRSVASVVALLLAAEALTGHDGQTAAEDREETLVTWEFHDLLFHARSRIGRHGSRSGATFPFVERIPPPPMAKPPAADALRLPRPATTLLGDMSLAEAVESRRSIRHYGEPPITVEQLAAFLYHVARVRSLVDFEIDGDEGGVAATLELSGRPYPAGGAIYEIELYPVVDRCVGLEPGMYRYDPLRHALEPVRGRDALVERLLLDASLAAAIEQPPQVLISLAARFQRMAWKYRTLAYAATLKNVGVLYQTMYLVATAMGLAPCALGNGNSELFAQAAKTDFHVESTVGEFMLGSRAAAAPGAAWPGLTPPRPNPFLPTEES